VAQGARSSTIFQREQEQSEISAAAFRASRTGSGRGEIIVMVDVLAEGHVVVTTVRARGRLARVEAARAGMQALEPRSGPVSDGANGGRKCRHI